MLLQHAKDIADCIVTILKPWCDKIEIAGSIRRLKPDVKDVEVICTPKTIPQHNADLFSSAFDMVVDPNFVNAVNQWQAVKGKPDGKYTQRIVKINSYPEIKLDLFMANPDNYGCIKLIRTGDWEFSKKFMGVVIRQNGYQQVDGFLKNADGLTISMPEEEDVFKFFNIPYIEPEKRNVNAI